ncbi:MAG: hypothetical protein KDD33_10475, partial [Bdellovibrionales bacterium]|nr:hypothetical protein [Bdellovibrionales bacterium]
LGVLINFTPAFAKFIPDEDIKNKLQRFSAENANMTQQEFNQAMDTAQQIYGPIISSLGGRLNIRGDWNDDTPNASAQQFFGTWMVNMYGGLARHPEMTLDGFHMVICHELGHHLAGYPFTGGGFGGVWAANEGQSDYFAAQVCAPKLWGEDHDTNATFRPGVHPTVAQACDSTWSTEQEQNLCYRISAAAESLARTLSALKEDPVMPAFDTPDANKVAVTDNKHPQAQCRMDTTFAAALCTSPHDEMLIPGKAVSGGPNSTDAEREASLNSCMEISNFTEGLRPRCWFHPQI